MYGNDIASAYELAKGYTRPVGHILPTSLPDEILSTHNQLHAACKLNRILRSNTLAQKKVKVGDLVQIYVKLEAQMRGNWYMPTPVLKYNESSQTVTVAGQKGRYVNAAVEDTRHAIAPKNDFSMALQEALDICEKSIMEEVESIQLEEAKTYTNILSNEDDRFDGINKCVIPNSCNVDETKDLTHIPPTATYNPSMPSISDSPPNRATTKNISNPSTHGMTLRSNLNTVHSADIQLQPGSELSSSENHDIEAFYEKFESKEFMLHEAQGLPTHITENAYKVEETEFRKSCENIHITNIPDDANILSSHVLYKIKDLDDGSKRCKARIAPHGNRDQEKSTSALTLLHAHHLEFEFSCQYALCNFFCDKSG